MPEVSQVTLDHMFSQLTRIERNTVRTDLDIHGGKDQENGGQHKIGLIQEFAQLKADVKALQDKAAGHGQTWWALSLLVLAALSTKLVEWAGNHIK